jgi:hypothetical protein
MSNFSDFFENLAGVELGGDAIRLYLPEGNILEFIFGHSYCQIFLINQKTVYLEKKLTQLKS